MNKERILIEKLYYRKNTHRETIRYERLIRTIDKNIDNNIYKKPYEKQKKTELNSNTNE